MKRVARLCLFAVIATLPAAFAAQTNSTAPKPAAPKPAAPKPAGTTTTTRTPTRMTTDPALLKPATIQTMTTPAPAYPPGPARYARGWMVRDNGAGNWWHNGSLPGSTTIMLRTSTGMCWAALTNTRTQPADTINTALDQMVWDMVHQVRSWNS